MSNKCYHDTRIPAVLFFEILESENLKRLVIKGKFKKKELRKAWERIFDEYFLIKDDQKLRLILRMKKKIISLNHKINVVQNALKAVSVAPFSDEDLLLIIEKLKGLNIHINKGNNLYDEIIGAMNTQVAAVKTQIEIEQMKLKEITKGATSTFEDNCVGIENVLGRGISEDVSLRKYLSYEKSAKLQAKKK